MHHVSRFIKFTHTHTWFERMQNFNAGIDIECQASLSSQSVPEFRQQLGFHTCNCKLVKTPLKATVSWDSWQCFLKAKLQWRCKSFDRFRPPVFQGLENCWRDGTLISTTCTGGGTQQAESRKTISRVFPSSSVPNAAPFSWTCRMRYLAKTKKAASWNCGLRFPSKRQETKKSQWKKTGNKWNLLPSINQLLGALRKHKIPQKPGAWWKLTFLEVNSFSFVKYSGNSCTCRLPHFSLILGSVHQFGRKPFSTKKESETDQKLGSLRVMLLQVKKPLKNLFVVMPSYLKLTTSGVSHPTQTG